MRQHTVSHPVVVHRATSGVSLGPMWRFVRDRFLLLPLGALIALVWANTASESYFRFAQTLAFGVNEIAMAFFLALVAQEVWEAVMPGGALHTWRRWGVTVAAAAGGTLGAAATYLGYVSWYYLPVLSLAWPVACAIDIAAGYYLLKTIFRRSAALPFFLLAAVATNLFGLFVVTVQRPFVDVRPGGVMLMLAAIGVAFVMRARKVRSFAPYIVICGTLSWWAFYLEGIHPALALVPIVPFLPHEPRRLDLFAEPKDDDAVHHFEHEWNGLVQGVLFMFGLVNAGVLLRGYETGTWAILAAALLGRPVGMLAGVWVATVVGFHLPKSLGWKELATVALATSSGFTFALFFATGLIPMGPVLTAIKIGALATVVGAIITIGVAFGLGVGRFAPHAARRGWLCRIV